MHTSILLRPKAPDKWGILARGQFGGRVPQRVAPFEPYVVDVEPGHGVHVTQEWGCPLCGAVCPHYLTIGEAVEKIQHHSGCALWSLVLVSSGVVIPEACDRAARCANAAMGPLLWGAYELQLEYSVETALTIAHMAADVCGGSVILS